MALFSDKFRASAWQTSLTLLDRFPLRHATEEPAHLATGRAGEEAAVFYLRGAGYTVIGNGWQSGRAPGDIDVIAWDGDVLCFIEVKTRTGHGLAAAEASVDADKRRNLRRLASHYMRQIPDGTMARFDILSIYVRQGQPMHRAEFELYRNAFDWSEGSETHS